jgi:hypothetical protein
LACLASAAALVGGTAHAVSIYPFVFDGCTGGCGVAPYGEVDVNPLSLTSWDVTVKLFGGSTFHDTNDSQHHALVFNLVGAPTIQISGLSSAFSTNGTKTAGSYSSSPFGSWEYAINYPKIRGPHTNPSSFSFNISSSDLLSLDYKTYQGRKIFFASDISSGQTGNTGNVAAVPEPATWAMTILGFGVLGAAMRRRVARQGVA